MKIRITNLTKMMATNIIVAITLLAPFGALAQKKACDARFDIKTDGYKIAVAALENSGGDYYWGFGDGTKAGKSYAEHTYQKEGVYVVCLVVKKSYSNTSNLRGCADTICKKVEIKDPCRLKVDFGFEGKGNHVQFKSRVESNANDLVYKWDFGGMGTSEKANPDFDFKKPGIYKVCLTVASKDGKCRETVCKVVEIKDPCQRLQAEFRYKQDDNKAYFESTTTGGDLQYEWTINGSKASNDKGFRFTFPKPGKYTVCLVVKINGTRCVSRECKVIEVFPPDPCAKLKATFGYRKQENKALFTSSTKGRNLVYEWTINGRKVSEKESFRFTFKEPGKYNVCLTVKIKGTRCVKQVCKVVVVKRPEPCRLEAKFRFVVEGNKVAFQNLSKGNNLEYLWTIEGKRVSDREHYATHLRPGKYKVCLTITNRNGRCKETYCAEVVITPKRKITRKHNLTTNGEEETAIAADNNPGEIAPNPAAVVVMNIYPNPAQDVLNLTVTGVQNTTVIISNLNGLVYYNVRHTITTGEEVNLPISHLPQGYYIAKVVSADGTSTTQLKFYKQ